MNNLINILKSETQVLREKYIAETIVWANDYFVKSQKKLNWSDVAWCKYFNLTPRVANAGRGADIEFLTFPDGFYNTKDSVIYDRMKREAISLKKMGVEEFVKREIKHAENHYNNSILKLAERIIKKGLDTSKVVVKTAVMDVNITTTITDGNIVVNAYTIIASGLIQRPHYRYLVK